jgi:hypothetical protein
VKKKISTGREDVHPQNGLNGLILNWCIGGCWFTPACQDLPYTKPLDATSDSLDGKFMVVSFEVIIPYSILRDPIAVDGIPAYGKLNTSAERNLDGPHQPIQVGERIVYS